jgi:hypothetical protein
MRGSKMKTRNMKSTLVAITVAATLFSGLTFAQDGFGPSRQPRKDNKFEDLLNPENLNNVFIPKEPLAAINEFLTDMNGPGGDKLVGSFFLAGPDYGKIVQTQQEAGAKPAGQIFYIITDTTLPNSPICTNNRGKVYMINSGAIFSDLGLIWSLIADRTQLNEAYFPKGAQMLGRPYSMKDFMTHMATQYLNAEAFNLKNAENRERMVDMAILGALVDSVKARISGAESKFKAAQEVLSQACTNDEVLIRQLSFMSSVPDYFKIEDREISILENTALPAAVGLPKFAPISEVVEQFKNSVGLSRPPVQLDSWTTQDGKFQFKTQPETFKAASKFWLIKPSDLPTSFTKCQHLNYTFLVDPYTEDPQQTGFMLKSDRVDLFAIANGSGQSSIAIQDLIKDFMDAAKIFETPATNGQITLDSEEQLRALDAFLLFQAVANIKMALIQGDAKQVTTMKAYAKDLCDPQLSNQVRKSMTKSTFLVKGAATQSTPPNTPAP